MKQPEYIYVDVVIGAITILLSPILFPLAIVVSICEQLNEERQRKTHL